MPSRETATLTAPTVTPERENVPETAAKPEDNPNPPQESLFLSLKQPEVQDGEPAYPTGFGNLTFSDLYAATSRTVGYVLRGQLGMMNPEDVDDCMQAGYLKVWQLLQKQPDLFAEKPKKYVVQAVVMRSKAQRYAHLRHYRKIVYDADAQAHQDTNELSIPQVETWIDLAQSIQRVAEYTTALDNPVFLLALYALITDVKTQDIAQTMRHGVSTLTAAKRRVRVTLANELPNYGKSANGVEPLPLSKIRSFQVSELHKELITPLLLEDTPPHGHQVRSLANRVHLSPQPMQYANTDFPLAIKPEVTYETRWKRAITLEELLTDVQVRKVAFAKMRSLGYIGDDAQDCFQLGTINLWKALEEQPSLLADKGAAWVGVWIAHSGSRRSLWKHQARSAPLHDPELSRYSRPEKWASWATRVDKRIDFTLLMNALAQRYENDLLKLYALYSLTTSVRMKDVQSVANAHKNQLIEARNGVKNDLRELLEIADKDISDEFWVDQLHRGENLECVTRVAERVMDNQRLLLALYIVTTSAKRKDVAELFSIPLTKFRKEIAQVKSLLAEEFRRVKRR